MFPEEKIERYLAGEMTANEIAAFEKKLSADPELAEEIRFRKTLQFVYSNKPLFELNDQLLSIEEEVNLDIDNSKAPLKKAFVVKTFLVAIIAFFILLFMGLYFYSQYQNRLLMEHKELVNQYAEPFENIFNFSHRDNSFLSAAMESYNNENYQEAIGFFEQTKNQPEAKFYLGICYLEIGESNKALQTFRSIKISDNPSIGVHLRWFTALALLQNGNSEDAKLIFQKLIESIEYKEKASEILKHL